MRFGPLLLLSVLLGSAACAAGTGRPEGIRPPRSVDEIEIIAGTPERPHIVVSTWEATVETDSRAARDSFRQRSVQRAADMGADAVVFTVLQEAESGGATEIDGVTPITTLVAEIIVWVRFERPPPPPSIS